LDVIKNRNLILNIRKHFLRNKALWSFYEFYWLIRFYIEKKIKYKKNENILYFGDFKQPSINKPATQLCTANQITSKIYANWCLLLRSPPRFSRKQWEFVFILQALKDNGKLKKNNYGLGFGCGKEQLPAVFANLHCKILATDQFVEEAVASGWKKSSQYSSNLQDLYESSKHIIDKSLFTKSIKYMNIDMNNIPKSLNSKFDFIWSACALEHLGSIEHGIEFILNSMKCLKKGGIAVHTTEFNLSSLEDTLNTKDCCIFRFKDMRLLFDTMERKGFKIRPINLHTGDTFVDRHVDLPPYNFSPHLKLSLDQFITTSIGIIIEK
jgi:hypothetical protein